MFTQGCSETDEGHEEIHEIDGEVLEGNGEIHEGNEKDKPLVITIEWILVCNFSSIFPGQDMGHSDVPHAFVC